MMNDYNFILDDSKSKRKRILAQAVAAAMSVSAMGGNYVGEIKETADSEDEDKADEEDENG